ncbi:VQ motif-containing protein 4-like [Diospyros lotus]|uniref:VQ motif-containing protein 4-like n=1 Tax=Diospyros lotus TaxID=55363 RepID=UPI002259B3A0|nr:VQ motif-containing protein 4-like [Diospyros lotus]
MENSRKLQENPAPSLVPSPNSSSSSSTSSNSRLQPPAAAAVVTPPTTPKPVTRSEPNNPYPTTFVQADTSSFKQVVQMLTGSETTAKHAAVGGRPDPHRNSIPPIKTGPRKHSSSRLYERRNSLKNFKISPLVPGLGRSSGVSPRNPATPEILSPSILDFPSLLLSPVTPLIPDPFNRTTKCGSGGAGLDMEAESQAIAKKGFYFHPSPANTPRESEPRLLPLFPVTSPRVSGSSS